MFLIRRLEMLFAERAQSPTAIIAASAIRNQRLPYFSVIFVPRNYSSNWLCLIGIFIARAALGGEVCFVRCVVAGAIEGLVMEGAN
jgi:hypothetical protein